MDIQDLKVQALRKALENERNPHASVEIISLNGEWMMQVSCYKLTEFSFYLNAKRDDGCWHPHCNMDAGEATAFLRGAGLQ